jgi:hypothetical protein
LPRTSVIVTTRWEIDLDGLKLEPVDELDPAPAQELLTEESRGRLVAGTPAVAEAAKLCGRLPVALLAFAAAVRTAKRPVDELLLLLRERREARTMKAVEAVFSLSEALLPEPLATRWHQLGVFPTSFDRRAAAAIWAEEDTESAQRDLDLLCWASLLRWVEMENRFVLHDLAREYCGRRLSEAQRDEASLRHARHYIAVGIKAEWSCLQHGKYVVDGLLLFERERTNLETAFAWLQTCAEAPSATLLISLVGAMLSFEQSSDFSYNQRLTWLEASRFLRSERRGNIHFAYRDTPKASEFSMRALVTFYKIGSRHAEGGVVGNRGLFQLALGDTPMAIEFRRQALVAFSELGARHMEVDAIRALLQEGSGEMDGA